MFRGLRGRGKARVHPGFDDLEFDDVKTVEGRKPEPIAKAVGGINRLGGTNGSPVEYYVPKEPLKAEEFRGPIEILPAIDAEIDRFAVNVGEEDIGIITPRQETLNPGDELDYYSYRRKSLQVQASSAVYNAGNVAKLSGQVLVGGLAMASSSVVAGTILTSAGAVGGGLSWLFPCESNVLTGILPVDLVACTVIGATVGAYEGFVKCPLNQVQPVVVKGIKNTIYDIDEVNYDKREKLDRLKARYEYGQQQRRGL